MAINVTVQHNGGFLPGIILLAQCHYPPRRGTRLNVMKRFCIAAYDPTSKRFDISPLTGGCSEVLDAFRFFFKYTNAARKLGGIP